MDQILSVDALSIAVLTLNGSRGKCSIAALRELNERLLFGSGQGF